MTGRPGLHCNSTPRHSSKGTPVDISDIIRKIIWLAVFGLVVLLAIRFTGATAQKAAAA